ncbi:MAG TPA: EamA family transporter [Candidatus Peribacteraceae bacterium]|nr:EamA family transporter [Candidatus Peribacteraceae bacterium]
MWIFLQVLSVAFWAIINVLDSLLVKHYEKHPVVLLWHQSAFSILVLIAGWIFLEIEIQWMWFFLAAGFLGYIGDLVFFRALDRIDVSITNIAWALLSVFLAITGILFLQETWSVWESFGSFMVFCGILFLSLWQRNIGNVRSLFLLPLLASLYVPFYFLQDLALSHGHDLLSIVFWLLVGREMSSFLIGLLVPQLRRKIFQSKARVRLSFHVINAGVIALFFLTTVLTALSFKLGPLSLVGVIGNVQPFFVLFFAWLTFTLFPRFAAREVLTLQSISVKVISFFLVFSGLALIALAQ